MSLQRTSRQLEDTIAAIATPFGKGAIGVIKISGEDSLPILKKIFRPKNPACSFKSHRLYYGEIVDREKGEVLDEVLAVYMKAPRTYTREDVVEIYAHSGPFLLKKIFELLLREGARPAKPGEFTLRAYLNGRIDLAQAEAIEELISAKTEKGLKLALNSLKGKLSEKINYLKERLLEVLSHVESSIEFPEEDIETFGKGEILKILEKEVLPLLEKLIASYNTGKVYKEGISLVLAGKPNVGKSSLMNALLKEERAIVTHIPGTTRDFLEEEARIKNIPVRLIDTAGLRDTEDPVEKIGVERAKEKLKEADLVLWVIDATEKPDRESEKIFEEIKNYPFLCVLNKMDVKENFLSLWKEFLEKRGVKNYLCVSAKTGENLDTLCDEIEKRVLNFKEGDFEVSVNLRQKVALEKCREKVLNALSLLNQKDFLPEILSIELQDALNSLSEITGEVTTEDLLNKIFSTFCIGK